LVNRFVNLPASINELRFPAAAYSSKEGMGTIKSYACGAREKRNVVSGIVCSIHGF
jgi:hypothetical protein